MFPPRGRRRRTRARHASREEGGKTGRPRPPGPEASCARRTGRGLPRSPHRDRDRFVEDAEDRRWVSSLGALRRSRRRSCTRPAEMPTTRTAAAALQRQRDPEARPPPIGIKTVSRSGRRSASSRPIVPARLRPLVLERVHESRARPFHLHLRCGDGFSKPLGELGHAPYERVASIFAIGASSHKIVASISPPRGPTRLPGRAPRARSDDTRLAPLAERRWWPRRGS